jgi:hypothetical protein
MDAAGQRSLLVDLDEGDFIEVTLPDSMVGKVRVTMLKKSGKRARLRVVAAPDVHVQRGERDPELEAHLQNWIRV